jgi:hypothetical protein
MVDADFGFGRRMQNGWRIAAIDGLSGGTEAEDGRGHAAGNDGG